MTGWRWWLGGRWTIEALVGTISLAGIVFQASGYGESDIRGIDVTVFCIYLALGLEYDVIGGRRSGIRPDPPTGRVALAGPVWVLAFSLIWLRIFDVLFMAPRELDQFERVFVGIVGLLLLVSLPAAAAAGPRPANWVITYNREHRQRVVEAERALGAARAQMLQAQMQPHFLYNALNTASALLRDEPQRGREVLLRLRSLVERTWTSVDTPMTTVENELAFIRDQLTIEQERFVDRLLVSWDIDERLLACAIPALSLQPLVENALKHGIARTIDGGHIRITVNRDADALVATVADSSNALETGWAMGTGLSNLRDRLAALYRSSARVTLTSDAGWTVATLRVPLRPPATTA